MCEPEDPLDLERLEAEGMGQKDRSTFLPFESKRTEAEAHLEAQTEI